MGGQGVCRREQLLLILLVWYSSLSKNTHTTSSPSVFS